MTPQRETIFTVGHSNHSIEHFIALLLGGGVKRVIDVRSTPYSRHHGQFNRVPLAASLHEHGMVYTFLGDALGARSNDPLVYESGQVRYDRLAATEPFKRGIAAVSGYAAGSRTALMCAEKEPLDCHRTLLVAPALRRLSHPIVHLLSTGELETHEATLHRLLAEQGADGLDLFRSADDIMAEALRRQERKIAFAAANPSWGVNS